MTTASFNDIRKKIQKNINQSKDSILVSVAWLLIGFSPRKANLSLYLMVNIKEQAAALKKLGKHKSGADCIYINKLEDIDLTVLKGMLNASINKK